MLIISRWVISFQTVDNEIISSPFEALYFPSYKSIMYPYHSMNGPVMWWRQLGLRVVGWVVVGGGQWLFIWSVYTGQS